METLTASKREDGVLPTTITNDLNEPIVYKDLSINDILGWMNQDSNRHYSAAVKEITG